METEEELFSDDQVDNDDIATTDCDIKHDRCIVHIDIDCFYAQVEMIENPSLYDKPLGIQQKNILVTCNYVARERGIGKCTSLFDAKKICPELVLVNGEDLSKYRKMSHAITELLKNFSKRIQRLGFDENFIDVTDIVDSRIGLVDEKATGHVYQEMKNPCICDCHRRLRIASCIAAEMRQKLFDELKITSCAGIAHNKLLSKLISGNHKPNQQTLIYPESAKSFMYTLPSLRRIPGVGHTMFEKLKMINIQTVENALTGAADKLREALGEKRAIWLKHCCLGIDYSPVTPSGPVLSISDEDSFKKCSTVKEAKDCMSKLLDKLILRILEDGRRPKTVRLSVRHYEEGSWSKRISKQYNLDKLDLFSNRYGSEEKRKTKLNEIGFELFQKLVVINKPFHLTLISLTFANFTKSNEKNGCLLSYLTKETITSTNSLKRKSDDFTDKETNKKKSEKSIKSFFNNKEKKANTKDEDDDVIEILTDVSSTHTQKQRPKRTILDFYLK
ncbi:DgyrCDS11872 [Dimorphilus gyrociliatus]|uniref:DgyrCDS11872 n=1 Tax=Dimorphilus gyrociliatus TaxID=2664684 RepID=A0A7I8W6M1_9ANNE|nr:DgyrCDS11872 [Dimorphilus gyrociliatus]